MKRGMNYLTELSVCIYIYIYIVAVACNSHCGIAVSHYRDTPYSLQGQLPGGNNA